MLRPQKKTFEISIILFLSTKLNKIRKKTWKWQKRISLLGFNKRTKGETSEFDKQCLPLSDDLIFGQLPAAPSGGN